MWQPGTLSSQLLRQPCSSAMENILYLLNSDTDLWQSLRSAALNLDPQFTFLSGLGLLFLYLTYLVVDSFLSTTWDIDDNPEPQDRGEIKRQGGMRRGRRRISQREAEEERRMLTILTSSFGEDDDIMSFRRALCPDPFCGMCIRATSDIMNVLFQGTLEDPAPSRSRSESEVSPTASSYSLSSSPSASPPRPGELTPASVLEPSPPAASILLPALVTPLPASLSPTLTTG
ncbi:spermatogenesis-associated protein 31D3-like [Microcebus murinus]|uniref:spermatogenesis-associated protein 31D3-like n=1 Tax=Microcebus murinus TaxID=30608 RepID=UPI003F6D5EC2